MGLLRLRKGVKNAPDDQLNDAVDICEKLVWRCGGLLVVGLLAEVALALIHPAYDSGLERWGGVVANIAVAIGVGGEVLAGRMAAICQAELLERTKVKLADAIQLGKDAYDEARQAKEDAFNAEVQAEHADDRARKAANDAASAHSIAHASLIGGGGLKKPPRT